VLVIVSRSVVVCASVFTHHFVCMQHQQQVAAAVERAKQVTMQELNAIIGVIVSLISLILSWSNHALSASVKLY